MDVSAYYKKKYWKKRKAAGICRSCPRRIKQNGRSLCDKCLKKASVASDFRRKNFGWVIENTHRFCVYGVTPEQYINMLFDCKGRCGVCRAYFIKKPHIDHSHKTGKVRSLLCNKCNSGLGHFSDNVDLLLSAVNYLRKFEEENNQEKQNV